MRLSSLQSAADPYAADGSARWMAVGEVGVGRTGKSIERVVYKQTSRAALIEVTEYLLIRRRWWGYDCGGGGGGDKGWVGGGCYFLPPSRTAGQSSP